MKLTTAEIDLILKRRAKIKRNKKKANAKLKKSTKFFTYDKSDYEKKQRERSSTTLE